MKKAMLWSTVGGLILALVVALWIIGVFGPNISKIGDSIFKVLGISWGTCKFVKPECTDCLSIVNTMPKVEFTRSWLSPNCQVDSEKVVIKFSAKVTKPDKIKFYYICGIGPRDRSDWKEVPNGLLVKGETIELSNFRPGCYYHLDLSQDLLTDNNKKIAYSQSELAFRKK